MHQWFWVLRGTLLSAPGATVAAICLSLISSMIRVAIIFLLLFAYSSALSDSDPILSELTIPVMSALDPDTALIVALIALVVLSGFSTWALAKFTWKFMLRFFLYATRKLVRAEIASAGAVPNGIVLHLRWPLVAKSAIGILNFLTQSLALLISLSLVSWRAFIIFGIVGVAGVGIAIFWATLTGKLVGKYENDDSMTDGPTDVASDDEDEGKMGKKVSLKLGEYLIPERQQIDTTVENIVGSMVRSSKFEAWEEMRSSITVSGLKSSGTVFLVFVAFGLVPLLFAWYYPTEFDVGAFAQAAAIIVILAQVFSSLAASVTKFGKFQTFLSKYGKFL